MTSPYQKIFSVKTCAKKFQVSLYILFFDIFNRVRSKGKVKNSEFPETSGFPNFRGWRFGAFSDVSRNSEFSIPRYSQVENSEFPENYFLTFSSNIKLKMISPTTKIRKPELREFLSFNLAIYGGSKTWISRKHRKIIFC